MRYWPPNSLDRNSLKFRAAAWRRLAILLSIDPVQRCSISWRISRRLSRFDFSALPRGERLWDRHLASSQYFGCLDWVGGWGFPSLSRYTMSTSFIRARTEKG